MINLKLKPRNPNLVRRTANLTTNKPIRYLIDGAVFLCYDIPDFSDLLELHSPFAEQFHHRFRG